MKKTKDANRFFIFVVTLILIAIYSSDICAVEAVKFPGKLSEIKSPDGNYILKNINYERGGHILYLKNMKTKEEKEIYHFDRWVSILWSPKGSKLMVNDYGGSDYSKPIIFLIDANYKAIDIEEQLREEMRYNKSIFGNHHVYIVGTKWLDENRVKIKVYGYGDVDPKGFTLWYEYLIWNGFKFIKGQK